MLNELTDLSEKVKENKMYNVAIEIVKLQKFKTNSAVARMKSDMRDSTKKSYFHAGLAYLRTGKRSYPYNFLYPFIDKAIANHIQALTPSNEDKRRIFKTNMVKKDAILPVAKLEIVNNPITAKFQYGMQSDNTIILFSSEVEAKGFMKGLAYTGMNTGKLVTVEIQEIQDAG